MQSANKKKALIVHAHPERTSVTYQLAEIAREVLKAQGHEVMQSDLYGMVLTARAGYNPFALPGVLTTLGNINPKDGAVSLLFSTHPSPRERLDRIEASVGDKLDRYAGGIDNTATFARLHK